MKTIIIIFIIATLTSFANHKYIIECNSKLLDISLDSAMSQLGTIELTNNNDGTVQKYLDLFNLKRASYCSAGQYWSFFVAAKYLRMNLEQIPIKKTAVAADMFNHGKKNGILTHYKPEKHDLIFWKMRKSYHGHVERVSKVIRAGWVITIGFNSNKRDINGNHIEGVFLQKRNIYHPLGRKKILGIIGFRRI